MDEYVRILSLVQPSQQVVFIPSGPGERVEIEDDVIVNRAPNVKARASPTSKTFAPAGSRSLMNPRYSYPGTKPL